MPIWVGLACALFLLFPQESIAQDKSEEMDRIRWGSKIYDNHREITYWGFATLTVSDYHYGDDSADRLKLLAPIQTDRPYDRRPSADLQSHFNGEFKRLFGDLPFNDLLVGRDERFDALWKQYKDLPPSERAERFRAAEEARRRSLYGGRAGSLYCSIRIKRQDFPVLYVISCNISAENDLRHTNWDEVSDINFSSPEHIRGELKRALTDLLKQKSQHMAKIRKYRSQE
jgi:hypothetical protein